MHFFKLMKITSYLESSKLMNSVHSESNLEKLFRMLQNHLLENKSGKGGTPPPVEQFPATN